MSTSQTIALSPQGARFIGSLEGFVDRCYDDGGRPGVGNCTIGIGHLVHLGPTTDGDRAHWGTITFAHALALLQADAHQDAIAAVETNIHVKLTQQQVDALISLGFNCGPGALAAGHAVANAVNSKPTVWNPIAMRAWRERVSAAFLEWAHPAVLLGRRQKEVTLFCTGKYSFN